MRAGIEAFDVLEAPVLFDHRQQHIDVFGAAGVDAVVASSVIVFIR